MRHSIAWPRSTMSSWRVGERLAGGRADALLDDVDAGRHLGHAVLDLHARVHLEEEVLGLAALAPADEQALDRARADVVDGARGVDADLRRCARASPRRRPIAARGTPRSASGGGAGSSSRARRGGSRCRGGRRAPGPRRGAGRAGSARGRRWRRRRTSRLRGSSPRRRPRAPPRLSATRKPLPPPPPAALTATGKPISSLAMRSASADGRDRLGRARDDRHARRLHQLAGAGLRAHRLDRARGRADEDDARVLAGLRERRVLGQEAVARGGSPRRPSGAATSRIFSMFR